MNWLKKNRDKALLLAILLLTAFLAGYRIWEIGDGNAYYTATVKSMLTSWHNFFYASFDPGGFITVDKPALGLWLQCFFGLIFGVHGWSLALPEIISSVISVAVLYHIVKRSFGTAAGLLAALFLALTPVFYAATRTNNLDASLVMVCLLAVWVVIIAAEKGSLKHLILAMALIGLGFNIKMLQAYLYLPAVYLVYFFTAQTKFSKRCVHLAAATLVLAAVSLSWCAAVDLTPADSRPYIGSSVTNSMLGLAVGYNGIARAVGADERMAGNQTLTAIVGENPGIPNEGGEAGLFRLFNFNMAGQASWLLVLAVLGLGALLLTLFSKEEADKKAVLRQFVLWLGLFAPMYVYFSITGHFHRYYLIMFAPAIAALGAVAVTELARRYLKRKRLGSVLLPFSVAAAAAVQVYILTAHYTGYSRVFVPVILVCAGLSVIGLIVIRILKKEHRRLAAAAAAVGILGLLAAPAYWSYSPIAFGTNAVIPAAGPAGTSGTGLGGGGMFGPSGGTNAAIATSGFGEHPVVAAEYMMRHYNGARFLVAVLNAAQAEPIILKYGVGVMAMGGFRGVDNAISFEAFKKLVSEGALQYYWVSGYANSDIVKWVLSNGTKIETAQWGGVPGIVDGTLYDLSGLKI